MEFYFPMFSDFRGRLYPLMNLLSYQGEDLSRALLIFGDSEVINEKGEEALKVYFSNLAGHDKDSWHDRVENSKKYFSTFLDYYENNYDVWVNEVIKLSEPFQFVSVFLSMIDIFVLNNKNISTPILFDATCSGIQQLSALTKEISLATESNVVSFEKNPDKAKPRDF